MKEQESTKSKTATTPTRVKGLEDSYSDEELKESARKLAEKLLPKWRKYCEVCKGCNCESNDKCIHCGSQF